ncbi:RNA-guided endonuclease InsQ/TnpB family protein [Methanobrevibacter sp.]|uniref:RNA-guided endonuclease InsQ/TnpB family protein n=1 Tax=Methanobrevibacter sp. TaxID=66852 RepID=UPI0038662DD4
MKVVNKNIEVKICPTKVDKNDYGEKTASINKIESNIGIYRFIYDEELEFINYFRGLLIQHGYDDKVKVNDSSCSVILEMLRQEYPFLEKAESSSRQQAQRDLINAFNRYYDSDLKSAYPVLKTRKKSKKFTFRIMNNNNNVRITKDKKGYYKIKLAKLGIVKFKTSKKYKELLIRGSDPNDSSVKIKHVTVKRVHDDYYAVFNIEYIHIPETITGPLMQVGIDIGCGKLAVLSNGEEIPNLCLKKETEKIIRYQKNMSHHKKESIRHEEARRLYNKWMRKLINKREDYYNKNVAYIVKNSSFVAVQNENIISWKHNKYLSHGIQLNAPRSFLDKLERKCEDEGVEFVKVARNFPSTQICSKCKKINKKIRGVSNLKIRDWDCPHCKTHHNRDFNAAKNILYKGLANRRDDGAVKIPQN